MGINKYKDKPHYSVLDLGEIELEEKVRITDPCYDLEVWCSGAVENVLPGTYHAIVVKKDEREWGKRVHSLWILHEDYLDSEPKKRVKFEVGVDSGQAGIFDHAYYEARQENDDWYRKVCDLTLSKVSAGIIDGKGAVSSSGYGDGAYAAYTAQNKEDKVIGFRIQFL